MLQTEEDDPGSLPKKSQNNLVKCLPRCDKEQELQQRKDDFSTISTPHPIIRRIEIAILYGEKKYTDIDLLIPATFTVTPHPSPESVKKIGVYDADERAKIAAAV